MPRTTYRLSRLFTLLALCAAGGGGGGWTAQAAQTAQAAHESGQWRHALRAVEGSSGQVIVKFRSDAGVLRRQVQSSSATSQASSAEGPQAASVLATRLGISRLTDGRILNARTQLMRAAGIGSQALAHRLASDPEVEWAVVDGRRQALAVPNDPLYPTGQTVNSLTAGQWYLHQPDSTVRAASNVEAAWDLTQGSNSVVVAVLDTGVRTDHPDLAGKLYAGYDFVSDVATANDGDSRDSDPADPGDWITAGENASGTFQGCGQSDSSWHGTQVAAIIGAATNNAVGMAGTAPNTMLLPVRVLGKCGGMDSDIIDGMRWAGGLSVSGVPTNPHPAKVLNLSLGGGADLCSSTAYPDAISELNAAGVVVVVAAGNDGTAVGIPGNCAGVIAVGGLRHSGTKSGFSSLGPEVAISSPGGNCVNDVEADPSQPCLYSILSAVNTGTTSPVASSYSDAFNYEIGTSFSTPIVAGTAALMFAVNPGLTPAQVRSLLQSSARSFPTTGAGDSTATTCTAPTGTPQYECYCTTSTCGAGMLNAAAAVQAASSALTSASPTAHISASALKALPGSSVALSGASSTASSGRSIASYAWSLASGSSLASFSGATDGATATLAANSTGTVTVRLTVTDDQGLSNQADQALTVVTGPPVASFTVSDSTPVANAGVTLDASASQGQGNATVVNYLWEIIDGASLASFSGSTSAVTTALQFSAAGSVTVQLTVTDSDGFTTRTSQTLTAVETVTTGGSSGGGGGSMSELWLAALALLGLGLRRPVASRVRTH